MTICTLTKMSKLQILFLTFLSLSNASQKYSSSCPKISYPGIEVGIVTDPQIDEASGMVASQTNKDLFWTLNDSQGPTCIYGISVNGTLMITVCLEGALNFDWEALSTAPCTEA